jgi:hypothetical protein
MGTTTNNGWTYPESTDLVKDGATAIETLATDIDTTLGVYAPSTSGLELINTTSFSAVSSFSLPADTFSATYENYKIVISDLSTSAGSTTYFRMRAAGSDATGANYNSYWWFFVGSSGNGFAGTSTSAPQLWDNVNAVTIEIFRPFSALVTNVLSSATGSGNMILAGGNHALTNSYDSMSFIRTSGTMTGKYSVYGYNI